uniref:Putative secreted protein n=1 Tax=Anopheles darlingi TaxID=43151 RepID=A0A2M4DNP5_ANODA
MVVRRTRAALSVSLSLSRALSFHQSSTAAANDDDDDDDGDDRGCCLGEETHRRLRRPTGVVQSPAKRLFSDQRK